MFSGGDRNIASITIEHGMVKLLVCRGLEVLDYRVLMVNPRFFREGQVSNSVRVAGLIQNALLEMKGRFRKAIGVVPGFQNRLRLMQFPRAQGLDPRTVIAQEAIRTMRVSTDTYLLSWQRLADRLDRSRWLVLATSRRSIASMLDTAQRAAIGLKTLELKPFALARAINQPEAVVAWAAPDGCDVVIVKDSVPVEHQSLFWGAELVEDTVLVDRLTEVVGRTLAGFNQNSSEGPMSDDAPLIVCGSPVGREPTIAYQVANNLGRITGVLASPLAYPDDFPINDLIVNIGLSLWEA